MDVFNQHERLEELITLYFAKINLDEKIFKIN